MLKVSNAPDAVKVNYLLAYIYLSLPPLYNRNLDKRKKNKRKKIYR